MIGLVRSAEPPGLAATRESGGNWASLPAAEKQQVRAALRHMSDGRCACCESGLPDDFVVEHFHPTSPEHAGGCVSGRRAASNNWGLTWSNLFAACDRGSPLKGRTGCSQLKGNNHICATAYDPTQLFGSPFGLDRATGNLVPKNKTDPKLNATVVALSLNRSLLSSNRKAVIMQLEEWAGQFGADAVAHLATLPGIEFITTIRWTVGV